MRQLKHRVGNFRCGTCKNHLDAKYFTAGMFNRRLYSMTCILCISNKKHSGQNRAYRDRIKRKIFSHYGNGQMRCNRCGFDDIRCLSVDHINGDGCIQRRDLSYSSGSKFYTWIIKNGFPDNLQILCMNCQFIKRNENNEHSKRNHAFVQSEQKQEFPSETLDI